MANVFFKEKDINKISLVAPNAKLNIIKNYKVVKKEGIKVPEKVVGIAKCMNPQCITNYEAIPTKFKVIHNGEIALRCHYCEKVTDKTHMIILKV